MELDPGTVVANRYRISRPLGRGGMGEVFAAENIRTGRPVAVKLLRSDSKTKSSAVARFRREARAAGSINSDHVTQVLDVEEDSEHGIVLVFELLEGESLIDRLKRTGPLSFDELHPIIEQVWIGLSDAHKAGIIHRDLKPSNVFLERRPDGQTRVKILDFGISKLPKEMGGETLTEMGQSLGTFSFMPPEQIGKAKIVDHRADIYACSTMIYQALTGQLPYAARNILVMVEMKTKTDPRRLADAIGRDVDARLEEFLAKGLARDPAKRFQTALDALAAWRELRPTRLPSDSQLQAINAQAAMTHDPSMAQSEAALAARAIAAPQNMTPIVSETTTDTAATLAIPLSSMTDGSALRRDGTSGEPAHVGRTVPLRPGEGGEAPGLGRTAPLQPRAPITGTQPLHQGNIQGLNPDDLPRVYDESTSTGPPSQEKTRVYRPQNAKPAGSAPMTPIPPPPHGNAATAPLALVRPAGGDAPQTSTAPLPPQVPQSAIETSRSVRRPDVIVSRKPKRRIVPLLLGAVAFAFVGFSIVAILLQYIQTGKLELPWPK